MTGQRPDPDETLPGSTRAAPSVPTGHGQWQVVLFTDNACFTHPVADDSPVLIGRSGSNTICIDDSTLSRVHAELHFGEEITITDAGSRNGTKVAGQLIPPRTPTRISPGDSVELGAIALVVQRVKPTRITRTLLSHDYFELRLEEECARRERRGGSFAVLRASGGAMSPGQLERVVHEVVRADDVVAQYAPGEYELLVDGDHTTAQQITRRLQERLWPAGYRGQFGVAVYPTDGTTPAALLAHANASQRGPSDPPPSSPITGAAGLGELVRRVARSNISVLILGETGVGKEVTAEAIHRLSPRNNQPFLKLNCAALTESLLESELFGHEKGSFTGATAAKPGLIESANGGTILLDEVGEMPLATQVKLLRVLEERKVTRVGALRPRAVDVRILAATHRDLDAEIQRKNFRQDLFFRLNGVTLVVPPLRERLDELPGLVRAFLRAATQGREPAIHPEATRQLLAYSWPGNVRELRNVIERAVVLSSGDEIRVEHLPFERMRARQISSLRPPRASPAPPSPGFPGSETTTGTWPAAPPLRSLREEVNALERQRVLDALEQCGWNQTQAAKMLGISRGTLIARLEEYQVARPRKR